MTNRLSIIDFASDHKSKPENLWIPFAIFILAFLIRLIYLFEIKSSPLFYYPQVDAETYVTMARQIANGNFFQTNNLSFYQPPLYPFLLAAIFKFFTQNLFWVHLLQFVLGSINCVLIYLVGRATFNIKVGLLSGIIASFYWPFIYFDGELLIPVLVIFLDLTFLLILLKHTENGKQAYALLAGLLLGLSAIARPNILMFGWIIAPVFIFQSLSGSGKKKNNKNAKAKLFSLALFLGGSFFIIAPVTLYNGYIEKSFVLVSYNGGLNFYIGNNPEMEQTIHIRPGEEWEDFTAIPKMENLKNQLNGADFSRYWYKKSLRYIKRHPFGFIKNTIQKAVQFFNAYEFKRNLDIYFFRGHFSKLLRMPLIGFAIICPLAILGMTIAGTKSPKVNLLLFFVLVYGFSIVIFFVTSRYRLPVVPIMIIFASFALLYIYELLVKNPKMSLRAKRSNPDVDQKLQFSKDRFVAPLLAMTRLSTFRELLIYKNIKKRIIPWKYFLILAVAICLVNIDIFHLEPGPQELAASEAESWYYIGRAEGDQAKNEKDYHSQIEAYKKAITTMQKSVAIDSVFSSPLTFMGIYKIKITKNLMRNFEADTSAFIKNKISIANEAMQNLGDAKKLLELAHHIAPQFASPLYNLCLALYFRNIIEFTFYGEHSKAVKMNIAKRCDKIDSITSELLHNKHFQKYEKYHELQRKARMQKKAVSGM